MPNTKTINITPAQRLCLYQAIRGFRPKEWDEMRQVNRIYREFQLTVVEDAMAMVKTDDELRAKFDFTDPAPQPFEITERGAAILRSYFDRMAEVFPAGKTPADIEVPAGLPAELARKLAPLVDAIDEAFPVAEGKAA